MSSIFPGIDPFLEAQGLWPDFHVRFINNLSDALMDAMPENYEARIGENFQVVEYESEVIEEEIRETYLKIIWRPDRSVVTIIEVLSPSNKEPSGQNLYLPKRRGIFYSNPFIWWRSTFYLEDDAYLWQPIIRPGTFLHWFRDSKSGRTATFMPGRCPRRCPPFPYH